jgi:hypothetical protein
VLDTLQEFHGKTTSAKRNSGRKSIMTEGEGLFQKITEPLQHRRTAAKLNIHLEDPVSTKNVRHELHKFSNHGRAAIAKSLITGRNAQMRKSGVMTIKPRQQTTGNALMIWSDESSFTLFSTSGRVYVWRTPREALQSGMPGSSNET